MIKDTSGPAFPADIPRINTVTPVASLSPAIVTLEAIRKIVREELQANAALEAAARQALEALESCDAAHPSDGARQWYDDKLVETAITALRAALAQPQRPPVTKGLPRKLPEDNDHGDWDRIDALEASLREHMAEIHRLRAALAQEQPVKVPHRHEWFSTDGMEPGQMRCIHCGVWGRSTATLFDPRGSLGEPIV